MSTLATTRFPTITPEALAAAGTMSLGNVVLSTTNTL